MADNLTLEDVVINQYFERCDDYDKMVCTGKMGQVAIPANADELLKINRHANERIDAIAKMWNVPTYLVRDTIKRLNRNYYGRY